MSDVDRLPSTRKPVVNVVRAPLSFGTHILKCGAEPVCIVTENLIEFEPHYLRLHGWLKGVVVHNVQVDAWSMLPNAGTLPADAFDCDTHENPLQMHCGFQSPGTHFSVIVSNTKNDGFDATVGGYIVGSMKRESIPSRAERERST